MTIVSLFLLLAAYPVNSRAGPVPRVYGRHEERHYANSSTVTSTTIQASSEASLPSSSLSSNLDIQTPSSAFSATLGTAISLITTTKTMHVESVGIVVTPIKTIHHTQTEAAITFVDPKGSPLLTQAASTLVSTEFIPEPPTTPPVEGTPTSSLPSASLNITATSSALSSTTGSEAQSSASTISVSSTQIALQSGTSGIESTQTPAFTYDPETSTQAVSNSQIVSATLAPAPTTTTVEDGTSSAASLPPDLPTTIPTASAPQIITLRSGTTSQAGTSSSIGNPTTPAYPANSSKTVLTTNPEPTSLVPTITLPVPSSTQLATDPVPEPCSTGITSAISDIESSIPTTTTLEPQNSASPSASYITIPLPPAITVTVLPSTSILPSNPPSSASAPVSDTAAPGPVPTITESGLEPAPAPTSTVASSSESRLIVTPIPASQIFTITETVTTTEKETVTATVTVTL